MEAKLQIGNISLLFIYQFLEYFGNELEQYKTNNLTESHHILEVLVQDEIQEIFGGNRFEFKNKVKITKDNKTYVNSYNTDNTIKHQVSYSDDYKYCNIILSKQLGKKLPEYEYVLSGMMFFEIAISNHYLPIHASAMAVDGLALLLSGPSKSGKSTQTKYFQEMFDQSIIINEDKPLIYEKDNRLYVCGSPWSGKHVINKNIQVQLGHIFFIHQSKETSIVSLTLQEKMKQLMRNIHRPGLEEHIDNTLYLVEKIMKDINVVQYNCVNDTSSSQYLKQYLEGLL